MVIDSLGKGGKERRMLELIKGLKNKDADNSFNIHLISLTDLVEYNYVYDLPITFEIIKRKTKKDFSIIPKLRRVIKTFQPDIIHSWGTMASIYLSVSNLFTGTPLINGVLADAYPGLNLSDKHYLRVKLTTPFSAVFIANSKAGIKAYRTPLKKSICIYNGIDFKRFENLRSVADIEIELLGSRKDGRAIIGMVATFDERKDYNTLVNAAIKMCSSNKKLVFLLIGDGPTLGPLKEKVPPELLNNQIIFTGRKDDIESILQIIDIGVLSTHCEGISNSIIEYMALGKPVIASVGGGTNEVVKDGINGFLVASKNEDHLIEKIELLFQNNDLADKMGQNGYTWVRQQFNIENKTDEYISLYGQLIKKKTN